jgi:hypothetical protein
MELQSLTPPIHLLVTWKSDIELHFSWGDSIAIEIQPRKRDVILFIESRLKTSQQLWNHILADPTLRELTVDMLTKANNRM